MSRAPLFAGLLRGAALFAGLFVLGGLLSALRDPALDTSHWLVDMRVLPRALRGVLLGAAAVGAVAWGVRGRPLRGLAPAALWLLTAGALADTARVGLAAWRGHVDLGMPPLSLGVALALGIAAWRARRSAPAPRWGTTAAAGGAAVTFALALMLCFGTTDYRRPADAVVVLGARAYADGSASQALGDRVRTAAGLVRDGYAPLLVVSGGPGDGAHHETDVMRRIALEVGVPDARIVADRSGQDTRATARNATRILLERGARSALVVSHAYHLPRVKAAFESVGDGGATSPPGSVGLRIYTVPADESRLLPALPWYVARETAAWWVYWMRARLG